MPVVTLELVDPRFYHLDTALAVLDDTTIAYYPPAFTERSRDPAETLFPDAIEVASSDAYVLGLNAVSDGKHVVIPPPRGFAEQLYHAGFDPIGVDLSELLKGGGSVKCCTLEVHSVTTTDALMETVMDVAPTPVSSPPPRSRSRTATPRTTTRRCRSSPPSAEGAWITDVEGRRYLDCLAAYSAVNFGHRHPRITATAHAQLDAVTLVSRAFHSDRLGRSVPHWPSCAARTWCCR